MAVDTSTIQNTMLCIGMWFESLLEMMLSIYFLYDILSYAVFPGCGVLMLLIPLNITLNSILVCLMQKHMTLKDDRINILSEVINGIKVCTLQSFHFSLKNVKGHAQKLCVVNQNAPF
jgi:hypothetical protein